MVSARMTGVSSCLGTLVQIMGVPSCLRELVRITKGTKGNYVAGGAVLENSSTDDQSQPQLWLGRTHEASC